MIANRMMRVCRRFVSRTSKVPERIDLTPWQEYELHSDFFRIVPENHAVGQIPTFMGIPVHVFEVPGIPDDVILINGQPFWLFND